MVSEKRIQNTLLGERQNPFIGTRAQRTMHGSRRIYTISTGQASPGRLTNCLHWKAHMSVGARRCACSAMAATWSHSGGGRANLCPHQCFQVVRLAGRARRATRRLIMIRMTIWSTSRPPYRLGHPCRRRPGALGREERTWLLGVEGPDEARSASGVTGSWSEMARCGDARAQGVAAALEHEGSASCKLEGRHQLLL
jgi:hypothetical protein